jgi:hypothetical protein
MIFDKEEEKRKIRSHSRCEINTNEKRKLDGRRKKTVPRSVVYFHNEFKFGMGGNSEKYIEFSLHIVDIM